MSIKKANGTSEYYKFKSKKEKNAIRLVYLLAQKTNKSFHISSLLCLGLSIEEKK